MLRMFLYAIPYLLLGSVTVTISGVLGIGGGSLITPALVYVIRLAEQGFVLQQGDANILNSATQVFAEQPSVAAIFLKDDNTPYRVGDRLVQKDFSNSSHLT